MLDAIIGIPSSGTWPPTTGVDGGIYREINLLQQEREAIGSVKPFFKPTDSYPLPAGWHVADGSTITTGNHDFTGIAGSVTLPDLRHAFVLGADPTKTIGTAAAGVTDARINTAAGAPGPNATGGENAHVLTQAEAPLSVTDTTDNAMIGTSQSWPTIDPVLRSFVKTLSQTTPSPAAHENRPRWVGLIYIVKIKFADTV